MATIRTSANHRPLAHRIQVSAAMRYPRLTAVKFPNTPRSRSGMRPPIRTERAITSNSAARRPQSDVMRAARPFHSATIRLPAKPKAVNRCRKA